MTPTKLILIAASLILLIAIDDALVTAQAPADTPLFSDALAAVDVASAARVIRERFVTPRFDLFEPGIIGPLEGRRDRRLALNLFPGTTFTAVLDRVSVESREAFVWFGHLEGAVAGMVTFALRGNVMAGEIRTATALYEIRFAGGDAHMIRQVDPASFPPDSEPLEAPVDAAALALAESTPVADDGSIVDVLVVYTPAASVAAGGPAAIQALIDLSIANTNTSYANSGVIQRVRLVQKAETAYVETDFSTDLSRLTGTADGFMDTVHALRDTFHADLVALIINDASSCGLAWVMNVNSSAFAPNGFSVNHVGCIAGNLTLAHEMGHNMSLNHDTSAPSGPFPYTYGRGYNSGTRRDIMAVASAQPRMQNFSNPAINFIGTAEPSGTADRNAALALDNTRTAVANFRQSAQAFGDHNGDGRSDILWQNDGGPIAMWLMNGTAVSGSSTTPIDMNWRIVATGDYNGDLRADVLWRHTSGSLLMWLMNGTTMVGSATIGNVDPSYVVIGSGDFNGDGKADILWRHTSGVVVLWMMDGTTILGGGNVATLGQDWQIVSLGDQNGDRRADILWRHTGGMTAVYLMDGTTLIGGGAIAVIAPEWRIVGSADFNGDGKADILWRHTTGQAAMWFMNGAQLLGGGGFTTIDPSWAIVGRGDYNGDGYADILWRHTSGQTAMWFMNGTTLIGGGGFTTIDPSWELLDLGRPPSTGHFSDNFEATAVDPFWTLVQQNGNVQLSIDQSVSGSQSAKLTGTGGGQMNVLLTHTFPAETQGTLSVWFYDSGSGLYAGLYADTSSPASHPGFSVNVADWSSTHYIWHGPGFGETSTGVPRSLGWHKLQLQVTATSFTAMIDNFVLGSVAGSYTFNKVSLLVSGPRQTGSFYFDDFSFIAPYG